MNRYLQLIKRMCSGENVLSIKLSADTWDKQFAAGRWDFLHRTPYNVIVIAGLIKKISDSKGSLKVLDVGCGNGALAKEVASAEIEYVGTDISSVAVAEAKKIAPKGTYHVASMDETSSLSEQFDILVFSEVLYYGEYAQILKQHKHLLRPDGVVIVSMYDTWRTRFIWMKIKDQLAIEESVFVKNNKKNIGWHIKVARYHT